MFNLLDASGGIGVTERMAYILRVRQLAVAIAKAWVGEEGRSDGTDTTRHSRFHDEHDDTMITMRQVAGDRPGAHGAAREGAARGIGPQATEPGVGRSPT